MRVRFLAPIALVLLIAAPNVALAATESIHREHTFEARSGVTVEIDVSFHKVEVRARPGDTVDVTVDLEVTAGSSKAKRVIEELEPVFRDSGDTLLIRSTRRGGFSWGFNRVKGHVVVEMPPGLDLVVDSSSGRTVITGDFGDSAINCEASSGSISMTGAAREISAGASSGSINLELSRAADKVAADASSGSVKVSGGARTMTADTSSGSIRVSGLLGDANLDASSGSVTAQWDSVAPQARIIADTSSGGVKLTFPAGTPLKGTVETSSGGIHSDFPGLWKDRRGHHLVLDGGPDASIITVDTSSGGVKLIAE